MKQPKNILITGATSGIGRAAALRFARAGHHVIATGRRAEALAALAAEGHGYSIDTVRLDVTDGESIAAAAAEVERITEGHGVDVLINNAGYGMAAPLAEITDEDFRAQLDTNVVGLMAVTRAFLPHMMARRDGHIINVSSVAGRATFPMFGVYHASKYAVEALSDALRLELAPFNIKVVIVEPGPIDTGFAERTMHEIGKYRSETSPYAPIYRRADQIKAFSDKQAVGPERVVKVMERAIAARRPRARYVVPFSARLLLVFLSCLPTSWSDALLRGVLGLTRRKLLAAPAAPPERLRA